jgi:hypothetical protein
MLNCVAMLMGAMGIVADVAAVPENISSKVPLIPMYRYANALNDGEGCYLCAGC